jgi:hypothetical protein
MSISGMFPRHLELTQDEYDWKEIPNRPGILWPHCKMSGIPLVYDDKDHEI